MQITKILASLDHYSKVALPGGELNLNEIPTEVSDAIFRIHSTLEKVPVDDRLARSKAVTNFDYAIDAPMDAPLWTIGIAGENGSMETFQIKQGCGKPDVEILTTFLEISLPPISDDEKQKIRKDIGK